MRNFKSQESTLNYFFAKKTAQKMKELFRDDYFRTWQASARQTNESTAGRG